MKRHERAKSVISFLLAVIMLLGMFPVSAVTAYAEEPAGEEIIQEQGDGAPSGSPAPAQEPGEEPSGNTAQEPSGAVSFTITYHLDGGVNASANPSSYVQGRGVASLAAATKTGYSFLGWYSDREFKNKVTSVSADAAANIALYAKFAPNSYTVSFDTAGGSAVAPVQKSFDSPYGTLPVPAREGFTFAGWYDKEQNGNIITAETAVKTPDNHTLFAAWEESAPEGTPAPEETPAAEETPAIEELPEPVLQGAPVLSQAPLMTSGSDSTAVTEIGISFSVNGGAYQSVMTTADNAVSLRFYDNVSIKIDWPDTYKNVEKEALLLVFSADSLYQVSGLSFTTDESGSHPVSTGTFRFTENVSDVAYELMAFCEADILQGGTYGKSGSLSKSGYMKVTPVALNAPEITWSENTPTTDLHTVIARARSSA